MRRTFASVLVESPVTGERAAGSIEKAAPDECGFFFAMRNDNRISALSQQLTFRSPEIGQYDLQLTAISGH